MVVNAATVLHLNPTAAECAYHFIKGSEPEVAAREIAARYRVSKAAALNDFRDFSDRVETLVTTPDLDPETYLDFDRISPHAAKLSAPLRLDCALTYRLPAATEAEYAPTKRVDRELDTADWFSILDKAWQAGIPHVTFTGGEATLRDDLVELVAHAEALGQVCGLLTDGLKLADKPYRDGLLQAGLDHILLVLQPAREASWTALQTLLQEDIFVTAHLTVSADNLQSAASYLERLASSGLKSLSLTFADREIPTSNLLDRAASLGLTVKYDVPVPYSADHPVARETRDDVIADGAGKAWLYVEPDGDVLPAQGVAERVLGNFLRDPWEKIYTP
jgi:MoaA/NifB/PqqE/SkfB family radical SAM enzyme